jgi:hypothetical protein
LQQQATGSAAATWPTNSSNWSGTSRSSSNIEVSWSSVYASTLLLLLLPLTPSAASSDLQLSFMADI